MGLEHDRLFAKVGRVGAATASAVLIAILTMSVSGTFAAKPLDNATSPVAQGANPHDSTPGHGGGNHGSKPGHASKPGH